MARDIPFSTSHYLWTGAVTLPISAYPFTLFARFNADSLADSNDSGGIIGLFESSAVARYVMYPGLGGDAKLRVTTQRQTGQSAAWSTGSISTGTWYASTLVVASATDKRLYLDTTRTDDATSIAYPTAGLNHLVIGVWSGPTLPLDGKVAEGALWNVALGDDEVKTLARGYSPASVRPVSLVGYWPLMGRASPEPDRFGTLPLSLVGTPTQFQHPRVIHPHRLRYFIPAAAAGGDSVEVAGTLEAVSGATLAAAAARPAAASAAAQSALTASAVVARGVSATMAAATDSATTAEVERTVAALLASLSVLSASATLVGQVTLAGTVTASSALVALAAAERAAEALVASASALVASADVSGETVTIAASVSAGSALSATATVARGGAATCETLSALTAGIVVDRTLLALLDVRSALSATAAVTGATELIGADTGTIPSPRDHARAAVELTRLFTMAERNTVLQAHMHTARVNGVRVAVLFVGESLEGGERDGPVAEIHVEALEAAGIEHGDTMVIAGRTYQIAGIRPDGDYLAELVLQDVT